MKNNEAKNATMQNTSAQSAPATNVAPATKEATKDTSKQSKSPASKQKKQSDTKQKQTSAKKSSTSKKTEAPKHNADVTKRKFTVLEPRATKDDDNNVVIRVRAIEKSMPAVMKPENAPDFVAMIQSDLLDSIYNEAVTKLADLKAKKDKSEAGEYTKKQSEEKTKYELLKKSVTSLRKNLKLENAKYDGFAHMIATDVRGRGVKLELAKFKTKLADTSKMLDNVLEALFDGKTIQLTKEQQEAITDVKNALKDCLTPFTANTEWCDAFKLSIGNKDIIDFYKFCYVGRDRNHEAIYDFSSDKTKRLEEEVTRYYLFKVGVNR